ncbi:MAG TPA: Gfo/Idh/MocA family oxidoreductase [Bacteroidota bacterium]|nr:Gfo/Idh/MocA family oxidoreductase [Bacteroidota bacterium]
MRLLRGALIGVGKIAQSGHLPAYDDERLRDRARIVAAVDPSVQSRRLATERFPGLRFYEALEGLLESESVDFVDICATPETHAGIVTRAVERGLHVLCEKPIAPTLSDADSIVRSAQSGDHSVVVMPCHQYRYSPLWAEFKAFVDQLGTDEGCYIQFNVFRTEADPGLLGGDRLWRLDQKRGGGGILADTGVHYLYLCLWMLGLPRALTARVQRIAIGLSGVEDTASVLLEYDRRAVQITLTWCADRRANSACIVSKRGSLFYDGKTLVKWCGEKREEIPVPDAADKRNYVLLYVSLIEEFIRKIHDGQGSESELREAHESVRLLESCYQSAAHGRTIELTRYAQPAIASEVNR